MSNPSTPDGDREATEVVADAPVSADAPPPSPTTVAATDIAAKFETEPMRIESPKQAESVFFAYTQALIPGSHLYSSGDKLGNLPKSISIMREGMDRAKFMSGMESVLEDPMRVVYPDTDKIKQLFTNEALPVGLRQNLVRIIMEEGQRSPLELYRLVQAELQASTDMEPVDAVHKVRGIIKSTCAEDDAPRKEASVTLLENTFPQLKEQSAAMADYIRLSDLVSKDVTSDEIVTILDRNGINTDQIKALKEQLSSAGEDDVRDIKWNLEDAVEEGGLEGMKKRIIQNLAG